jgi:hypothetical protein
MPLAISHLAEAGEGVMTLPVSISDVGSGALVAKGSVSRFLAVRRRKMGVWGVRSDPGDRIIQSCLRLQVLRGFARGHNFAKRPA